MDSIDIGTISSLQNSLSKLTGLYLSLYDGKGNIILPHAGENKLLSAVRSSPHGRDEYNNFILQNVGRAIRRSDISLLNGPAGQYHFFSTLHIGEAAFVIVGGGVYLSSEDFDNFYKREGPSYGLPIYRLKSWYPQIVVKSRREIQDMAQHITSVFSLVLEKSSERNSFEKRYRSLKTIYSVMSDIRLDRPADEVYEILTDIVLFLFDADSVSVMARGHDVFTPQKTAGRLKDSLESINPIITGLISEVVDKKKALYSESVIDILRLGYGDDVASIHLFPILSENNVSAILSIFNSDIQQEDAGIISEICCIAGFVVRVTDLRDKYVKCLKEIDTLNSAASHLTSVREPDMLYEVILDTSVNLASAEKGSLMLVDSENPYLTVKAAKGINRRLLDEIKIMPGEGIAGKVFKEGLPVKVDDMEKNEWGFFSRPKYRTSSFISVPLKIGERSIGVLNISDKITREAFSDEDLVMLRSFASYASIALERSTYYSLAGHLKELSITDSLTGLFNRRYFEERFFEELHRSDRHNLSFSLAMIDIDDFKLFNDSEGHLAGDEMLKCIANIAKDSLRVIDVIARIGGEEFSVIMPQTEKDEALLVAERIRRSLRELLPCTWKNFPRDTVTVSIGIATFPYDGKERKELIRNSDKALYTAKMEGKDRTILYKSQAI
jgi:diguanylate cyclase (GGDEF)-like protein